MKSVVHKPLQIICAYHSPSIATHAGSGPIHIDHRVIGDPASGCGKTYQYSYDCGCGVVSGTVEPEASGKDISIDCAACDPEAGSAAACQLELHQHGGFGGWGVTFDNGDYNLASLVGPGPPGSGKHP